jgi:hypothetical protein
MRKYQSVPRMISTKQKSSNAEPLMGLDHTLSILNPLLGLMTLMRKYYHALSDLKSI